MLPLGPPVGLRERLTITWVVASSCAVAVAFLASRLDRRTAHPRPAGVSSARGERGWSGERMRVQILRRLTPGGDRAKHVSSRLHFVC